MRDTRAEVILTIVNALVLPVADDVDWYRGWLSVDAEGRIAGLGEGEPPSLSGHVVDAGGAFVAPGFVSAHSHLFTSGMRGMTPGDTLYPWVAVQSDFIAGAD